MKNKFELFYFLYIKNISLQSLNVSFLTVHIYQHLLSVLNKREIHSVKVSQMMYNFKLFRNLNIIIFFSSIVIVVTHVHVLETA